MLNIIKTSTPPLEDVFTIIAKLITLCIAADQIYLSSVSPVIHLNKLNPPESLLSFPGKQIFKIKSIDL